jgi:hypothetical protein
VIFFLGEFSHCGYKEILKKLGKFVLIVWIQEKNAHEMEKINKVYKPQNWKKKEREKKKKHWYRGIYVCTLNKIWKNMLWN